MSHRLDPSRPLVLGPLGHWERSRLRVLADVVSATTQHFQSADADTLLGEALYLERQRLKREKANFFTKKRLKEDAALWGQVQSGLLRSPVEVDRKALLRAVTKHYAEEIGAHFDPKLYGFATRAVPWFFSWLLNAASVKRFNPWGMTQSLQDRLRITGEVEHLQKLAEKGTILLVPTHQSNIDSVLIGYVIYQMGLPPFSYGAGLNLFSNPVLSFFMSSLGAYTVDRKKNNAIYKEELKNYSTRILQEGVHSIFFPGGGRVRSGAIETKLKLGLLGTGLEAQALNLRDGAEKPSIFVVPMTTSYHFVLEAASLIEDYLAEAGKARFIITDDESWQPTKIAKFFWRLFSSQSSVTIRIGKPLDVFGNFVDENGVSQGPNGTTIDPRRWLTTRGKLGPEPRRDMEYTRELGARLVDRYHREATVLTSHAAAFALFEALRAKYPQFDLYKFLRLSPAQRTVPLEEFLRRAERLHQRLLELEKAGELHLAPELKRGDTREWSLDGVRQLGIYHEAAALRVREDTILTEDMNLLYYYRNRLSGYGLSLLSGWDGVAQGATIRGIHDQKGFLA